MRTRVILPSYASYLLRAFLPALGAAVLFFVLILELADLFMNLVQYMQNQVPLASIVRAMVLYAPRCVAWSIPVATLFSISYTLGTMHANNELMAVYASGVSMFAFALPFVVFSFILSFGYLVFEDAVVIPTQAAKRAITKQFLKTGGPPAVMGHITIVGSDGLLVWSVANYDAQTDA
ncbi:MAG TPA: LptF/LptG family permease, partial [Spirochaetales bacterium]|nr:LptF/LptG family permease [Spirochaetales bacterium]